jgi:ketosteroid isomerase-like protein
MNSEQRRAIEWDISCLIHKYANLNDAKRWEDIAVMYAEDGLMIRPVATDQPIVGRAAILASFRARPAERMTRHICSNVVVTVETTTTATAFSNYLIYGGVRVDDDPVPVLDSKPPVICEFHDRLVYTKDGWSFALRKGVILFRA